MPRLPTAAALAILLVTAGVAGVVSAEPNSTDYRTTTSDGLATTTDARLVATTDARVAVATVSAGAAESDVTFEQRLARRLAQYDLTDAQVREIVTEASRLREAGASRLVIRSSVVMNLYEFGVDAPFLYADSGVDDDRPTDDHQRLHRLIRSLDVTPEQARELHAMVHRMFDDGATREVIRAAIREKLAGWDVDRPDSVDRVVDVFVARYDLDRQQAAELERLIRGMIADGADRSEIREAVGRLFDSYGIDGQSGDAPRSPADVVEAP